jgi:hypothetical protein
VAAIAVAGIITAAARSSAASLFVIFLIYETPFST